MLYSHVIRPPILYLVRSLENLALSLRYSFSSLQRNKDLAPVLSSRDIYIRAVLYMYYTYRQPSRNPHQTFLSRTENITPRLQPTYLSIYPSMKLALSTSLYLLLYTCNLPHSSAYLLFSNLPRPILTQISPTYFFLFLPPRMSNPTCFCLTSTFYPLLSLHLSLSLRLYLSPSLFPLRCYISIYLLALLTTA